jgi:hypothetical protein
MRALDDLDDAVERLQASLEALDRGVTRLQWAMAGWGLVLTAEGLLMAGFVWWGAGRQPRRRRDGAVCSSA